MNEELLRGCFQRLRKDAAAGIDEMTKAEYAENLESNLVDLVGRLHRMAYIPQAVRRKYISKPGSAKLRPLGIPCFEDKLVQAGLVRILESIYENDSYRRFIRISSWSKLPRRSQGSEPDNGAQADQPYCRGRH